MQSRDQQLGCDEEQNHRGDPKELLQIYLYRALDEHHAEQDRGKHSQQRSKKALQRARFQRHCR